MFSGTVFRPPILVSSGPHLTVRFNGNGETARGFNMQYSFVSAGMCVRVCSCVFVFVRGVVCFNFSSFYW